MRVVLTCVCSAMYPCVGLLVSCVFGPCPAMSICACGITGVLLCVHRPLVVCTILLSLSVNVTKEDAADIAVHLCGMCLVCYIGILLKRIYTIYKMKNTKKKKILSMTFFPTMGSLPKHTNHPPSDATPPH